MLCLHVWWWRYTLCKPSGIKLTDSFWIWLLACLIDVPFFNLKYTFYFNLQAISSQWFWHQITVSSTLLNAAGPHTSSVRDLRKLFTINRMAANTRNVTGLMRPYTLRFGKTARLPFHLSLLWWACRPAFCHRNSVQQAGCTLKTRCCCLGGWLVHCWSTRCSTECYLHHNQCSVTFRKLDVIQRQAAMRKCTMLFIPEPKHFFTFIKNYTILTFHAITCL